MRAAARAQVWRLASASSSKPSRGIGRQFGMTNEALRFRKIVALAPVSLGLKVGGQFAVAVRADRFGHSMFFAPPAFMAMLVVRGLGCRDGRRDSRRGWLLRRVVAP